MENVSSVAVGRDAGGFRQADASAQVIFVRTPLGLGLTRAVPATAGLERICVPEDGDLARLVRSIDRTGSDCPLLITDLHVAGPGLLDWIGSAVLDRVGGAGVVLASATHLPPQLLAQVTDETQAHPVEIAGRDEARRPVVGEVEYSAGWPEAITHDASGQPRPSLGLLHFVGSLRIARPETARVLLLAASWTALTTEEVARCLDIDIDDAYGHLAWLEEAGASSGHPPDPKSRFPP